MTILISDSTPKPSDESTPSTITMPKTMQQETQRFKCRFSRSTATIASTKEMDEVSAAKKTRTKNTAPIHCPPGRLLKTAGSCTNISEGPELFRAPCASVEKAKMEGMMMVAATMAKAESQMAICSEDFWTLTSFFIYEP